MFKKLMTPYYDTAPLGVKTLVDSLADTLEQVIGEATGLDEDAIAAGHNAIIEGVAEFLYRATRSAAARQGMPLLESELMPSLLRTPVRH